MNRYRFLPFLMCAFAAAALAQGPSDEQIDAERQRIGEQRKAVEVRQLEERKACYQRFAVEDCLRESRRRGREEADDLRRQESALNDIQRKRRGAEQLRKLDERQASPPGPTAQEQQDSREAQRAREDRAAERARSRAEKDAASAQNRADFESRQQQHTEDAAAAARRRAEAPEARKRYEDKLDSALRRREARERREAERGKPPAAPLPVPGAAGPSK